VFEPGFYHVCLTVLNSETGCQSEICHGVEMIAADGNVDYCFAEFTYFIGDSNNVEFHNESEGAATEFYWHFAGEGSSNEANPVHQFNGPGFYEVCLGTWDENTHCGSQVCHPIEIFDTTGQEAICFAYIYRRWNDS
jgi:PKD repeat protein